MVPISNQEARSGRVRRRKDWFLRNSCRGTYYLHINDERLLYLQDQGFAAEFSTNTSAHHLMDRHA
jgi:hypothetical protein